MPKWSLNASSISPSGTGRLGSPRRLACVVALSVLLSVPVSALDPDRGLSQYIRDEWSTTKGYGGGAVYGFAQGEDGDLWIAAEKGLIRFDGLRFTSMIPRGRVASPAVLGIASSDDGTLLARLRGHALVAFRDGAFGDVVSAENVQGVVPAMSTGRSGSILIASHTLGILRHKRGTTVTVVGQSAMPRIRTASAYSALVTAIAETDDGFWIGTRDAGLFRARGQVVERVDAALPDVKINCLLADDDGSVWVGTDRGLVRVTTSGIVRVALPRQLGIVPVLALLRDRDANVWLAAGSHGVIRLRGGDVAWLRDWDVRSRGMATALFEDRERNVWIGTSRSVERMRDGTFATYSGLQALPSDRIGPVYVDGRGRPWFASTERGLFELRGDQPRAVAVADLERDVVYSLDGQGSTVWVGRRYGGLTRVEITPLGVSAVRYTERDGLAQDSVYVVHVTGDGAVWAGTLSGGASRLRNGLFETFSTANGLVSNSVQAITSSTSDVWIGTPDGASRRSGGQWRSYRIAQGLPSNDVVSLLIDRDGHVWAGTAAGLAVLRAGGTHFEALSGVKDLVLSLLEDGTGTLWMATADRLLRAPRVGLLDGQVDAISEYDASDGLISHESVRRQRTLAADARGRVWFASTGGLAVADPARFTSASVPAVPRIVSVEADGVPRGVVDPIRVAANPRRLSFSFAAVSLALPERIRYRYRLDQFDRDWSSPSAEQTAAYTNLAPGRYTFRVMASDSAGRWTGGERAVSVEVLPAVWQTLSFQAVLFVGAGLVIWVIYRLRLNQVERQLRLRFEERLGERVRIAQDLHDTLLQGFLGASMHLHVVAQQVPEDTPAREKLAQVQRLMGRVIDDGRDAIRGLRAPDRGAGDLEHALEGAADELGVPESTVFGVTVEGRPSELNPLARDEAYRIGREALANAICHARAHAIDVTLAYRADRFVLIVRDDGRGIGDEAIVASGRDGHWGLAGMRERAATMGATLDVRSRVGAGTEIELSIPSSVAFRGTTDRDTSRWADRLRSLVRR
jgi:signal transduction histidine kinase/ligand-binding sensor domain-containing protein